MKRILMLSFAVLLGITANSQTLKTRSDATFTQVDQRLAAGKNFYAPSGTDTTLNGGINIPGALFYQTKDSTLYVWKGKYWRAFADAGKLPVTVTKTFKPGMQTTDEWSVTFPELRGAILMKVIIGGGSIVEVIHSGTPTPYQEVLFDSSTGTVTFSQPNYYQNVFFELVYSTVPVTPESNPILTNALAQKADTAEVVHRSGDQTISGNKVFTAPISLKSTIGLGGELKVPDTTSFSQKVTYTLPDKSGKLATTSDIPYWLDYVLPDSAIREGSYPYTYAFKVPQLVGMTVLSMEVVNGNPARINVITSGVPPQIGYATFQSETGTIRYRASSWAGYGKGQMVRFVYASAKGDPQSNPILTSALNAKADAINVYTKAESYTRADVYTKTESDGKFALKTDIGTVDESNLVHKSGDENISGVKRFTSTAAIGIPVGTDSQKPSNPTTGDFRWNSDYWYPEIYDGYGWNEVTLGSPTSLILNKYGNNFYQTNADIKIVGDINLKGGTSSAGGFYFRDNSEAEVLTVSYNAADKTPYISSTNKLRLITGKLSIEGTSVVLPKTGSVPVTPEAGEARYSSSSNRLAIYNGTQWKEAAWSDELSSKANDIDVVHKSGTETISGLKKFTDAGYPAQTIEVAAFGVAAKGSNFSTTLQANGVHFLTNSSLFGMTLKADAATQSSEQSITLPDVYGVAAVINTMYTGASAPESSSATGVKGEIRIVSGYLYICTAPDTWVRAAVSSW